MRSPLRHPRLPLVLAIALPVAGLLLGLAFVFAGRLPADAPKASPAPAAFTYSTGWTFLELGRHIESGEVVAISVPAATSPPNPAVTIIAKTKDGQVIPVTTGTSSVAAITSLQALGYGSLLTTEALGAQTTANGPDPLTQALTIGGVLLLLVVLVVYTWRKNGGLTLGRRKSEVKASDLPLVSLDDVAGIDEAKFEIAESIEFLRAPERFTRLGAKPVRGVMLYGPPGGGKTLLARAVAAEANVPFFSMSGSEFVEMYVGVGARRVRDLFAAARKRGQGVIFIDEIDAVAKARGGPNSHEEREQTLNQLLVELDGFTASDSIVVIAATNRLDTLDPAVLRPGRFTRKINVPLPDRDGRLAILEVHARQKPLDPSVDLAGLARKTYGFSGAMLADLLNEAAIFTARGDRDSITPIDIHAGWLKTAIGTSRQRSMDERERAIIAAHEAGHAVLGRLHGNKRRVEEISLFQHGDALGVTVSSSEDNMLPSETDLRAQLISLMGGRVAEDLLFSECTGGASNDFEKATELATLMVTRFGMGIDPTEEPGVTGRGILSTYAVADPSKTPIDIREAQSRAIRSILDRAYDTARTTLTRERIRLNRVAAYLFEQERIDGNDFDALMEGHLSPEQPDQWRVEAANPREWPEVTEMVPVRRPRLVEGPEGIPTRAARAPAGPRRRESTLRRTTRSARRILARARGSFDRGSFA